MVAVVGLVFGIGYFKAQVEAEIANVQKTGDEHTAKLQAMSERQSDMSQAIEEVRSDVSVLSAVVQERTGKPVEEGGHRKGE